VDLAKKIREELIEGEVMYADKYGDFYTAATGGHHVNMINRVRKFYWRNRKLMDLRSHILLIGPPGWGKSYFIKQFMEQPYGILCNTGIDLVYQQFMTAAGWVGTGSVNREGELIKQEGEAEEHKFGIIGCEEFHGLFSKTSGPMVDALLATLDDGHLVKKVAAIRYDYQTFVTMFAGTQIEVLNLGRGLLRRLTTLVFLPSRKDEDRYRQAYLEGKGRTYNERRLKVIRVGLINRIKEGKSIKGVKLPDEFDEWINKRRIKHFEIPIYERLIIGYNFMAQPPNQYGTLDCQMYKSLYNMLENEFKWRNMVKRSLPELLLLVRVKERPMKAGELMMTMADLGVETQATRIMVEDLVKRKMLTIQDKKVMISERASRQETD